MRALITGSEGFLGRHFVAALSESGWAVTGCDVRGPNPYDARDVFRDPDSHWDLVVHCAAIVGGRETIDHRPMEQAIDFELDAGLFRWALESRTRKVVYLSSSAAYPVSLQCEGAGPLSESDIELAQPELPDALYGWTKLTGERLAFHARQHGLDVLVVRPFSGYGEDQDHCYPFPAIMCRALNQDNPFVVWGSGQQVRDFVHVDDIVGAVLAMVDEGFGGPVNIGTGSPTSMSELAHLAGRVVGYKPDIAPMTNQPQGVLHRVADVSLMNQFYVPKVSLEAGIRRALEPPVSS